MNARSVLSTIVVVALLVFVGVLWGGLTVMVKTLRAPDVVPEAENASTLIDEVREFVPEAPRGEDAGISVVQAAKELGQKMDGLKELGEAPPALPQAPAAEPPAVRDTREGLARGDCAAASAAVLRRTGGSPDLASHVDEVWDCFATKDKDLSGPEGQDMAAALPDVPPGADGAPVTLDVQAIEQGVEARLASYNAADALGFGAYLQDLMGAATLAKQLTSDLGAEASLAEWASVASPPSAELTSFFADRMKGLAGGMSGAAGEAVRLQAPEAYDSLQSRMAELMGATGLPSEVRNAWLDGMKFGLQDDPLPPAPAGAPAAATAAEGGAAAPAAPDAVDEAIEAAEDGDGQASTEECVVDEPTRIQNPTAPPAAPAPDAPAPPPSQDDATPEPAPE
jgi:hypothetical protein